MYHTPDSKGWLSTPETGHRQPLQQILPPCNHTDYRALGFIQDSLNHLLKVVQSRPEGNSKMDEAMHKLVDTF